MSHRNIVWELYRVLTDIRKQFKNNKTKLPNYEWRKSAISFYLFVYFSMHADCEKRVRLIQLISNTLRFMSNSLFSAEKFIS